MTDSLTVFIPGALKNPLNGGHGHWRKHATTVRRQREKAELYLLHAMHGRQQYDPKTPKRITFEAVVWNAFDDDNLRACLKPTRDALKSMGVIDDDRSSAGHTFVYQQRVDRARGGADPRGVRVMIEVLTPATTTKED